MDWVNELSICSWFCVQRDMLSPVVQIFEEVFIPFALCLHCGRTTAIPSFYQGYAGHRLFLFSIMLTFEVVDQRKRKGKATMIYSE